jgi:predicted alpha/beta hydrolase
MTPPPPYRQEWLDRGPERIGLQWYDPPADPAAPMVAIWPAMGVPARFYRPFAGRLRDNGLAVVVADLRGTGASTPAPSRRSRYGYQALVDDVGAVLAALKPHRDGRRLVLLGHSLGGQLCLLHLARATAAEGAADIDGLALVAVGLPYWRIYPGRSSLRVLALTRAVHLSTTLLRVWPGWGFGGRQARGVIRDWAYTARTGRFPQLSGVDTDAAVAAVRAPVLAVSLQRDYYTPASTLDHLLSKLTAAPVLREHYQGEADHFNWARTDGPIAERVTRFVTTRR